MKAIAVFAGTAAAATTEPVQVEPKGGLSPTANPGLLEDSTGKLYWEGLRFHPANGPSKTYFRARLTEPRDAAWYKECTFRFPGEHLMGVYVTHTDRGTVNCSHADGSADEQGVLLLEMTNKDVWVQRGDASGLPCEIAGIAGKPLPVVARSQQVIATHDCKTSPVKLVVPSGLGAAAFVMVTFIGLSCAQRRAEARVRAQRAQQRAQMRRQQRAQRHPVSLVRPPAVELTSARPRDEKADEAPPPL